MAYLGIDAGASATKWVVSDGLVALARGTEAAMDAHLYRPESLQRFDEVISAIVAETYQYGIDSVLIGITGYSTKSEIHENFGRHSHATLRVMSDIELAYRANFPETPGILIYAGTGSVAFTQAPDGELRRVGGWGYLLGDEGAGYWIGREAIRRTLELVDMKSAITPQSLPDLVLQQMPSRDWNGIKNFVYSNERSEIARFSRLVAESAERGDHTALEICKDATDHLVALINKAESIHGSTDAQITFAGGISSISEIAVKLSVHFGDRFTVSTTDIALGAALLASHPAN